MPEPAPQTWFRTLGWAAYLACSWTWCIGMFLPVLLIRDFGPWGFVVFAVPNVVGAAAMGWVVTCRNSAEILRQHRAACLCFSLVTLAFHVFFVANPLFWVSQFTSLDVRFTAPLVLGVSLVAFLDRSARAAVIVLLVSIVSILVFGLWGNIRISEAFVRSGPLAPQVPALAAVCVFGFSLCPYLDLTFHRGLQHAASASEQGRARGAFTIGFGVMFLSMILFTLWYSPLFAPRYLQPLSVAVVSIHLLTQIGLTVGVHARAALDRTTERPLRTLIWLVLAAFALMVLAQFFQRRREDVVDMGLDSTSETIYRLFMSAYGLFFPAYVYLCMLPTREPGGSRHSGPRRDKVRVWLFACGVAAPMYWMGFIERQTWWLVPGLGVVLLSRLALRWMPRAAGTDHATGGRDLMTR